MFKNRIIEYGVKPADQFLAHPRNAHLHPTFQRDAMKAALDTVGFVAPVLEAASGYLVDGHERIWQALQNGNADVPFVRLDISEDEEAFVLATFDPITSLAQYDADLLDSLLREVNSDSEALQMMLSNLAVGEGLVAPFDPNSEWVGMPEFEQDNVNAFHSIRVDFSSPEDIERFSKTIGQTVTDSTKSIYYPAKPKREINAYIDES